jgi:hypothetical protein
MSASIFVVALVTATLQGAGTSVPSTGQVSVSGYVPSLCGVSAESTGPAAVRCSAPLFEAGVEREAGTERVTVRPLI